jgi:hypothetical protein
MATPNPWLAAYESILDQSSVGANEAYDLATFNQLNHPETDLDQFTAGFMCAASIFCADDGDDYEPVPAPEPFEGALA